MLSQPHLSFFSIILASKINVINELEDLGGHFQSSVVKYTWVLFIIDNLRTLSMPVNPSKLINPDFPKIIILWFHKIYP